MSCGCNNTEKICSKKSCQPTLPCSCAVRLNSDCITVSGADFECSEIDDNLPLTEVLMLLDAFICDKFTDLAGFTTLINIGAGAEVYKGIDGIGRKEIRKINATGDLVTVTQNTNDISVSIDEVALEEFINDLVLPPPVIDPSFLRTIDSTVLNNTLKVISDNANNASVLKLSIIDLTNNGAGANPKNTAFGQFALTDNTTGEELTAFGTGALAANTTGTLNTAVGKDSLLSNDEGSFNTAVGANALINNINGDENTSVGAEALKSLSVGAGNVGIGYRVLLDNLSGSYNVAAGRYALENHMSDNCVAIGNEALRANTIAQNNTAVGFQALHLNTTGDENVAVGANAAADNVTGEDNTVVGAETKTNDFDGSVILGKGAESTANNQFSVGSPLVNAGTIVNETVTSTKTWNVVINGVMVKVLLASSDDVVIELGNFGYDVASSATACTESCTATNLVAIYRDNVFGAYELATQLATDALMTIPAPAGYYAEFSTAFGEAIVRFWDGTNFIGAPELCGC